MLVCVPKLDSSLSCMCPFFQTFFLGGLVPCFCVRHVTCEFLFLKSKCDPERDQGWSPWFMCMGSHVWRWHCWPKPTRRISLCMHALCSRHTTRVQYGNDGCRQLQHTTHDAARRRCRPRVLLLRDLGHAPSPGNKVSDQPARSVGQLRVQQQATRVSVRQLAQQEEGKERK